MFDYSAESFKEIQSAAYRYFSLTSEGYFSRSKTSWIQADKYLIINAELCE
jgi:hypothetical protein